MITCQQVTKHLLKETRHGTVGGSCRVPARPWKRPLLGVAFFTLSFVEELKRVLVI